MTDAPKTFRRAERTGRWADVDVLAYKAEGAAPFKDITRQVLFGDPNLASELRYFEIAPGGHSTLERHEHVHAVMIFRGRGQCMVGDRVMDVGPHDLISIPSLTWHQFRASAEEPLGFLCMVNRERDRPQLPNEAELQELRVNADIAAFLDGA
jgi:mannose-6-phosphate isomerase-like protein (cupin superfamily)